MELNRGVLRTQIMRHLKKIISYLILEFALFNHVIVFLASVVVSMGMNRRHHLWSCLHRFPKQEISVQNLHSEEGFGA